MKTKNICKSLAALSAFLIICAVACDEPVEPVTPVFPDPVENYQVAPGDTLSLTFTPNMDWEVSVPEDTMDFFWIIDESFQYSRISGKVSEEPVIVKIGVSDKPDFFNHTTTVRLTMGGETRIIARLMRPAEEKSIQLYTCQTDEDGAWVFDDDGNYSYSEIDADTDEMKLVYTGSDFRLPIKVVSNFEYSVEFPEWALADLPEEKSGTKLFNMYGVPAKYPLDETSGKIVFRFGDEIVKEYVLVIPGCRDIFSFGLEYVSSINFTESGEYKTLMNFHDGPVEAWIEGTSLVEISAFEIKDGKYVPDSEAEWLTVDVDEYQSGSAVLQRRSVRISADVFSDNTEERSAVIFFLPYKSDPASLFTDDAASISEEYAESVVYVNQKRYGYLTIADETAFAAAKGSMTVSSDETLKTVFGAAGYAYEMIYKDQWASDDGMLILKKAYEHYKIFNKLLNEAGNDFFLTFNEDRCCIEMSGEVGDEGYIVFYDSDNKVLAVVKCIYEPPVREEKYDEDQIRDASMYFKDPDAAEAVGAKLEEIWAGPTFYDCEDAVNDGAVLLRLSCKENTEVEINIPSGSYMVAGYPRNCFNLGNLDLSAGAAYLNSSTTSLAVSFTKAPESFAGHQSLAVYNNENKAILVVYCCVIE